MERLFRIYLLFINKANLLSDIALLICRLWIAKIFFSSGLVKIEDFETTIFLFKDEYMVPFISPYFAAISGTFFELACPILLVLGVFSRLAAIPLIIMTAVIQFTYDQNIQHYYWAILLFVIFSFGAGKISLDNFIEKKLLEKFKI